MGDNVEKKGGLFAKLKDGLTKTRQSFSGALGSVFSGFSKLDDDFLEELEDTLISADVGVKATLEILDKLKERAKEEKAKSSEEILSLLKRILIEKMRINGFEDVMQNNGSRVLLIAGINGVGKTTSIGKLAHMHINNGDKVMLAAADTFRAAASEQLEVWAKRANVPVISQKEGSDPAAVVFDACASFKSKKLDVLICDTAGRLHNKKNLMEELKKIERIINRECEDAQKACYIVIDATTGQNGIEQARVFKECVNVTGIVLTKLDGTAKGGIVIAIGSELGIPVRYIGVGEGMEDLQPFDAETFVDAIF